MDIDVFGPLPKSVREFLKHLSIVTTGILIALSLEGAVEWSNHRSLVRETRERLGAELRSNQDSIRTVIKTLNPARMKLVHALGVVSDLTAPEHAKEAAILFGEGGGNVLSGMSFAYFNTAAFTTAQATGAIGYMDYAEALKYADAYDLQALYARMQDDTQKAVVAASILGIRALSSPTASVREDMERQILLAIGGIHIVDGIAHRLDELYTKALKED